MFSFDNFRQNPIQFTNLDKFVTTFIYYVYLFIIQMYSINYLQWIYTASARVFSTTRVPHHVHTALGARPVLRQSFAHRRLCIKSRRSHTITSEDVDKTNFDNNVFPQVPNRIFLDSAYVNRSYTLSRPFCTNSFEYAVKRKFSNCRNSAYEIWIVPNLCARWYFYKS